MSVIRSGLLASFLQTPTGSRTERTLPETNARRMVSLGSFIGPDQTYGAEAYEYIPNRCSTSLRNLSKYNK